MARLVWGSVGERFYEAGADRGVLYVGSAAGVAWNGLTSVKESPSGGDPQPYYIDGYKYINIAAAEEFEATLEAFSSPKEFAPCDGTGQIANGLFITQQPRQQFNLSYRTRVGNDVAGTDLGYKLHLIYNALAAPSSRDNNSIGDKPDPNKLSWDITVRPPRLTGYKPSAHLVIDSRTALSADLTALETILYGQDFIDPRFPTQAEVITLFTT